MGGDQPAADNQVIFEQHPKNSLQAIVVEKVKTLKNAYLDDGIVPNKDNTTLYCAHQHIISLDDLSALNKHWHLHTLTDINFSYNKIETFPRELFFECPNLTSTSLAHNKLKTIALNLPHHQNLKQLYLHNNKFKGSFPLAYLLQVAPLERLTLYNNPEITDLGDIPHKCPIIKQFFIGYDIPEKEAENCTPVSKLRSRNL
jgi:Leucine-rich repeat (LRR) protein